MFRIFFAFIFLFTICCSEKNTTHIELIEKIENLQLESKNTSDTLEIKKKLELGISLSEKLRIDTVSIHYKRKISCEYFNHRLLKPYYFHTKNNLYHSIKINDSVNIAKLYLDLGDYHQITYQIDSAYFYYRKALPYYSKVNKYQILTNYELARLLCKENLNLESEVLIYQNLQNAINLGDPEIIQNFYIIQGINYYETEQYDKALQTFYDGFPYIEKIPIEFYKIKNDYKAQFYLRIGMVYQKTKNYQKARKYYDLSLKTLKKDGDKLIKGFALIFTEELNILQKKPINLDKCYEALQISEDNNVQENIVNANHLLAKYFFKNNNIAKALYYSNAAIKLAKEIRLNYNLYEIYKTLSENNIENKEKWLVNMLEIKELISQNERLIQNKFAKINFETENVHQKAKTLEKKIKDSYWIFTLIVFIILIIFILYKNKINNKIKKLDKLQKQANLEVYDLLVEQHDLVEKGKNLEKSRISKELHDGIASELYGVRLGAEMDYMKNVEYRDNLKKISENLRVLEKNVRSISHELVNFSLNSNKLIDVIKELVQKHEYYGSYIIKITINEAFYAVFLPNHLKINLYRIIQESLTNIDKYSNAKNVIITIDLKEKYLFLKIKDNGIGFIYKKSKYGIGIKNMQERVKESNGKFRIVSKPNIGTIVHCIFDLSEMEK